MKDIKLFFELLWLNLMTSIRNSIEWMKVVVKYYTQSRKFARIDLQLLLTYLFASPFRVSKKFLTDRGEKDVYAYGETPLTTLDAISRQCGVSREDVVFELGSGRGRSCFWLREFIGCDVVGVEWVPEFVKNCQRVRDLCGVEGLEFRCGDMTTSDLTGATVVYLYGTCLDAASIRKLVSLFEKLPSGTKIITVSYPLSDYAAGGTFEVMKRFPMPFTWGVGDVYLQCKT